MSPWRRMAGQTFSSLQSPNVRLYFTGLAISQVGTWIQLIALPWLVLRLTHSGTAVGLTYGLQFLPILLLGAWAGVVADRYDKRRLLMITSTLLGLVSIALGLTTLLGLVRMWNILVIAFALGAVAAFDNPTRRAFVAQLVPPEQLTNAVSLNNAFLTSTRIVGPSIAGILIATVGIGWCFVLNGASFAAVILAVMMMSTAEIRKVVPITRGKGQLREGIRFAWDEPLIRLAILMTFVVGILPLNYQVVLPLLAKRTFHGGANAYALMFAAAGIGSVIGALIVAHRARVSGRLIAVSSIAFGAMMGLAAMAPTLTIEYLVLIPMGAAVMTFFSTVNAAVQERATAEVRGRLTALLAVAFLGSTPIGSPIVGAISQELGARAGLAVGAIAAVVAGAVALVAVRRWHRPAEEALRPIAEVALPASSL